MLLSQLLVAALLDPMPAAAGIEITGIAYDSRRVAPGNIFVAVPGFHVDGARFVADAIGRSAAAVVVNRGVALPDDLAEGVNVIAVADTRSALASLAAAWYRFPARDLTTIGVTGTDGKTSTSYLIAAVLNAAGLRTGLFTTVAYLAGGVWESNESRQTTPEAPDVQSLLRRMVDYGDRCAVLESSSHGLELHKLDHCFYDRAVFTNLSPDHLDFHKTLAKYQAAKGRLFRMLDAAPTRSIPPVAVVNADDPASDFMTAQTRARTLRYAIDAAGDVRPTILEMDAAGTSLTVATPAGPFRTRLGMPGRFSVYNALAAATVGISLDVRPSLIGEALAAAPGVPGRMQRIDAGQPFTVVVDYAHTGAAFEKVLQTLRPLTGGRLIALFGSAGERGTERRTGMGAVAARAADYTLITTEDPRGEDPLAIIDQIASAMTAAGAVEGRDFERVPDRRQAIGRALALAASGDLVLLAGKGHEHTIETAVGSVPWDEAEVAMQALRAGRR